MNGCTAVRYTILTHVFKLFLYTRVIIRTKHARRKTSHSVTAVVLALYTSS